MPIMSKPCDCFSDIYVTGNPTTCIRAWAPGSNGTLPLTLQAEGSGHVGLSFNPIYNAQWKETGQWEQSYHANPKPGARFVGWFDMSGGLISTETTLQDEYGAARELIARFD
ncbi:MAG: hypothetical protein PUA57_05690 [Eggerthellales bacterium]|nr:hypothetical protein [Eggerthellales bacterium]